MVDFNAMKWDARFMRVAKLVSEWSKDPSTKVGAVLVKDREIVATGYNGFPAGIKDTDERLGNRDTKYSYIIHAEMNALLQAGTRADGCTLYLWFGGYSGVPCVNCAKHLIQAGVKRIVYFEGDIREDWQSNLTLSMSMLVEAGVQLRSTRVV